MTNETFSQEDIEKGKGIAWLSYFGIFLIIPLLIQPNNLFVKAHIKQGLALLIIFICNAIIWWIPIIGWIVGTIVWILGIILAIIGIINSISGKYNKLPVIGNIADAFKF